MPPPHARSHRTLFSRLLPLPLLLLLLDLPRVADAMIQNFHYVDETNPIFQLETFGFRPGGGELRVQVVRSSGWL